MKKILSPGRLLPIGATVGTVISLVFLWQGCQSVLLGGADLGWLIRTGQFIVQSGHLPAHDIFTWTCGGRPFFCYQWLFELLAYALHQIGGLSAVGAVSFTIVSVLYLYYLPKSWIDSGVKPALVPVFMALSLTPFWFFARPQLVSFVFSFVFVQILEKWRKNPNSKWIFVLPLLTVIWANLHCFAFISAALIAIYLADALAGLQKDKRVSARLLISFLLSAAGLVVTPIGLQTIVTCAGTFVSADWTSCNELEPLFVTSYRWSLSNLYVLSAGIALLLGRRKVPRCGLLISLAALVSGLLVARLQPLGVLLSWPFVGLALAQSSPINLGFRKNVQWFVSVVAVSLAFWFYQYPGEQSARRCFLGSQATLQLAAQVLKSGDHLFTDTLSGSRLIYLGGPPVFIDSRLFVFDQAFYKEWLAAMNLETPWQSFAEKWKINCLVLTHGYPLYDTLMKSPEWKLSLDDGGSSLWMLNEGANSRRLGSAMNSDQPETLGALGEELVNARVASAAKHFQTASIYLQRGLFKKSRQEAEAAQRLVPSNKVEALLQKLPN